MNSVTRGALLAALAVLIGFVVLRWGADLQYNPVVEEGIFQPTPTALPAGQVAPEPTVPESVAVAEPTVATDPARPNAQVVVLVANGTEVDGQAGRLTDRLRNQGFNTRAPKSATPQASSVIYYRPGYAAEATVVRETLNTTTAIAPMPEPDPNVGDLDLAAVNVFVLVGSDALSTG